MNPAENIYFFLLGFGVLFAIIVICFIFQKRKKMAIVISIAFVIGFAGYYCYYPTIKMNTHAERFQQIQAYLEETYPDKQFAISPQHYEPGYIVGEFEINDMKTPSMGVTLRVNKDGNVSQIATLSNTEYPTQQELWREIEFYYGETYSLDKEMVELTNKDYWIDGELTAFALTINDVPSIAIFNYSTAGYSLLELKEGERGKFVAAELDGYLFIYIDDNYEGELVTIHTGAGNQYTLNALEQKGKLIVKK
ncbi:hypothetical protein [Solibacillus cecembensis]|uniref:hypothetical protein n=1 Tax=Solibacillus cecembensis TaxID=459347 RepID=UPI003CFBD932